MKDAPKNNAPFEQLYLVRALTEPESDTIGFDDGAVIFPVKEGKVSETASFALNHLNPLPQEPDAPFHLDMRLETGRAQNVPAASRSAVMDKPKMHLDGLRIATVEEKNLPVVAGHVFKEPEIFVVAPLVKAARKNLPLTVSPAQTQLRADKGSVKLPGAVVFMPDNMKLPDELIPAAIKGQVIQYPAGNTAKDTIENRNTALAAWLEEKDVPFLSVNKEGVLQDNRGVAVQIPVEGTINLFTPGKTAPFVVVSAAALHHNKSFVLQATPEAQTALLNALVPAFATGSPTPLSEAERLQAQKIMESYKTGAAPATAIAAITAANMPLKKLDRPAPVKAGHPVDLPKPEVRAADNYKKQTYPDELYKKIGNLHEYYYIKPIGGGTVYTVTRAEMLDLGLRNQIPDEAGIWCPKGGGIEHNKWVAYGGEEGFADAKQTIEDVRKSIGPQGLEMYTRAHSHSHDLGHLKQESAVQTDVAAAAPSPQAVQTVKKDGAADSYHAAHKKLTPEA